MRLHEMLAVFSGLIFLFAARESFHNLMRLTKKLTLLFRTARLRAIVGVLFLMVVSTGPLGYYGIGFLNETGIIVLDD